MSHVLLLDSNVWSHLILGDAAKREKMKAQLAALRVKYPGAVKATSGICVAECLVAVRRLADKASALQFEALLQTEFSSPDLTVVEVTQQVLDNAATLRAMRLRAAGQKGSQSAGPDGGKLLLPDAIIAASCLDFTPPAILVTENAADFRFIEGGVQKTVADLVVEPVG
jgi:predicted nucleic acid-binding protein